MAKDSNRAPTVLIVDDVVDNVTLLTLDLEDAGYRVVTAYGGVEAIEVAKREKPDVILLDVMMPDMDGYSVCRQLKEDSELAPSPVIFLTARSIDDQVVIGLDAGGHDYVTKPYEPDTLLARIRSAIRVKEAHDTIAQMNVELEQARKAADHASQAKSEFLSSMSHELRTPLNSVIGMTDLALETELPADAREYVATAHRCGRALLSVINDILDFSKIEAGSIELEMIDFHLRTAVEEALEIVSLRAQEKGIEVLTAIDHDVPVRVRGDPTRIRQVLLNLLNNAIKFTNEGVISLRIHNVGSKEGEHRLRFEVVDSGIGIPQEKLGRLFRSFSQVDASTTRRYGGSGLGLAICRRLVEVMGGEIGVESVEGEGSTFWFEVPLQRALSDHFAHDDGEVELGGTRVLLLAGATPPNPLLDEQLASWGCRVEKVENGADALKSLLVARQKDDPFRVVIFDVTPQLGVDVEALADEIRCRPEISEARMVVLTSMPTAGDAMRFERVGVALYLPKPYETENLQDGLGLLAAGRWVPGRSGLITRFILDEVRKSRVKLLLIEWDREVQTQILRPLRSAGLRCDVVRDATEARNAAREVDYDVVFIGSSCGERTNDLVRSIHDAHGGDQDAGRLVIIGVSGGDDRSEEETACCDARLSLPVDEAELRSLLERFLGELFSELRAASTVFREEGALEGVRLLIVDDSDDNRALALAYLRRTGVDVQVAKDGQAGVERCLDGDYDVVLMDMLMPVKDGYVATAEIRAIERSEGRPRIPILALTASAFREDVQRCLDAGCDGHIAKPMTKQLLISAIRNALPASRRGTATARSAPTVERPEAVEEARPEASAEPARRRIRVDPDLAEIVPDYIENRNGDVGALRHALAADDFATVRTLGHNMKGSGAAYGFDELTTIGRKLEMAAKNGDAAVIETATAELEHYLANLEILLD